MAGQSEIERSEDKQAMRAALGSASGPWLRRAARALVPFALYFLAAASTLDVFMTAWGKDVGRMFAETVELERKRPWAYRVLTPLVLRGVSAVTPDEVKARVLVEKPYDGPRKPSYSRVERARRAYDWGRGYDFEYLTMYAMLFGSLLLTQVVWARQLRVAGHSPMLSAFAPPLAMLALPLTFAICGYIYDFPELLLASLCLLFFVQRRWVAYYVSFALAVLNKESSVLWAVWCLALWPEGRALFRRHAALHLLVGGVPFVLVRIWMADMPGLGVEIHVLTNLEYWADPKSYAKFLDFYAAGLPTPAPGNLLLFPFALFFAFYGWCQKDRTIRVVFASSVLMLLPFYIVMGFDNEIRVFTPCIPAFVMLSADSLCRLFAPGLEHESDRVSAAQVAAAASVRQVAAALRTRQSGSWE